MVGVGVAVAVGVNLNEIPVLFCPAPRHVPILPMKTNIDELTIGEARQLASLFCKDIPAASHPFEVGKNYFIRTVTHHLTGTLVSVYPAELVLLNAAWIADDGRLADALKKEEFNEVEPFPEDKQVVVGRGSIIDAVVISKIPRSQK